MNAPDRAFADFGRGWESRTALVDLLALRVQPLHALSKAWTPGAQAPVEGAAGGASGPRWIDFGKYRGQRHGRPALRGDARDCRPGTGADSGRLDQAGLDEWLTFPLPRPADAAERGKRLTGSA